MTIYEQDDWYEWMEDNDLAAEADLKFLREILDTDVEPLLREGA